MAFSTSTTARWRILSSSAAIPSGRAARPASGCTPSVTASPGSPAMHSRVQVLEVRFESPARSPPRHAVDPRRGVRANRPVRRPQAIDVDVVQERSEPRVLVLLCDSAHTIQRTWRALSGSASGTRFAGRVPLGQAPSLHRLRHRVARSCSAASQVLRACLTSRGRSSRAYGLGLPLAARPPASPGRAIAGPPGSRAWRFRACTGSSTARGPPTARE